MSIVEKVLAGFQYALPHHLLSSLVHALMRIRFGPVKNLEIGLISWLAGVD